MTKPIEWTTTRKEDVPQRRHLEVCVCEERDQPRPGGWQKVDQQWATPADLSAALAAMPQSEAEQVIRDAGAAGSFDMQTAIITDLRTRLKEATRLHSEAESSLDVERALRGGDARYADAKLNESIARAEKAESFAADLRGIIGSLVDRIAAGARVTDRTWDEACLHSGRYTEDYLSKGGQEEAAELKRDQETTTLRVRAEKAERERDEARRGERAEHDAAVANLNAADKARREVEQELGVVCEQCSELLSERDDVRVKNDGLRDCLAERKTICEDAIKRAIAAETAAAQREPESRGCSYTDAVTLFRRDPRVSWTCDELQMAHGPDASCRFVECEPHVQFTDPSGYYSGHYTPTNVEAKSTTWRRVESKPAPKPREYPLAPGSRWDGDEIVELDGTRTSAVGCTGGAHIRCVGPWGEKRFPRLADVLALARRRGLL